MWSGRFDSEIDVDTISHVFDYPTVVWRSLSMEPLGLTAQTLYCQNLESLRYIVVADSVVYLHSNINHCGELGVTVTLYSAVILLSLKGGGWSIVPPLRGLTRLRWMIHCKVHHRHQRLTPPSVTVCVRQLPTLLDCLWLPVTNCCRASRIVPPAPPNLAGSGRNCSLATMSNSIKLMLLLTH